jgi:hypothetical protein
MEPGSAASVTNGWGNTPVSLGASDAFKYLSLGKGKSIEVAQDQSITSNAFKPAPRQVKRHVEKSLSHNARYLGMGDLDYWRFGFSNDVYSVVVFVLNTPSVDPASGDEYTDPDLNTLTFVRKETWRDATYYVFAIDYSDTVSYSSGDLTRVSGSGDATLTFTSNSGKLYEHIFELSRSRHLVTPDSDEQFSSYVAGDKLSRMCTFGVKMATNDFRYPFAMCSRFSFNSEAGGFCSWDNDFIAYDEQRGDYGSASWTFPSGRVSPTYDMMHHHLHVEIGESESSLVSLGVTSLDFNVDIPLQVIQDTASGLYISEPVLSGFYGVDANFVLSRYSAETYQDLLDAWTSVVARIAGHQGFYMSEILIQEAKIDTAGPDDDNVAKEPLHLVCGSDGSSNNWSSWLYGRTPVQKGPAVIRVRNDVATNYMY